QLDNAARRGGERSMHGARAPELQSAQYIDPPQRVDRRAAPDQPDPPGLAAAPAEHGAAGSPRSQSPTVYQSSPRSSAGCMVRLDPLPHIMESAAQYLSQPQQTRSDRKSTRLNSSHVKISYAVFCLKKKKALQL